MSIFNNTIFYTTQTEDIFMEQFLTEFHSQFISYGNKAAILQDFVSYSMPLFLMGLFWFYAFERTIVYLAYYQENEGHNFTFNREIDNFLGVVVIVLFATLGFVDSVEYIYAQLEVPNILTELKNI